MDYHQSVVESYHKLVLYFAHLKYLDDVDPFNISGVDRGKESEQGKGGVDVTAVMALKKLVVNGKPVKVPLALGGMVACNTIF